MDQLSQQTCCVPQPTPGPYFSVAGNITALQATAILKYCFYDDTHNDMSLQTMISMHDTYEWQANAWAKLPHHPLLALFLLSIFPSDQ